MSKFIGCWRCDWLHGIIQALPILTFSARSGRSSSCRSCSRRLAWSAWAIKGGPRYGIDFRGGALITVSFANRPRGQDSRGAFRQALPVEVQEVSGKPGGHDRHRRAGRRPRCRLPARRSWTGLHAGVRTAGQRQVRYQLRVAQPALADHLRDRFGGRRVPTVRTAAATRWRRNHGLPEAAFRSDPEPG